MSISLSRVSGPDKETHRVERQLPKNILPWSLIFIIFLVIGVLICAISAISDPKLDPYGALILAIVVCGSVGGTLLGIRKAEGVLQLPTEEKNRIRIGFIGDAAQGAAGAIIIFLLIPYEISNKTIPLETMNVVKLLALALLGGYAGPYLFDLALSRTLASISKKVDDAHAKLGVLLETDAEAIKLSQKHIRVPSENAESVEKLKEVIRECSERTKLLIFNDVSVFRRDNWRSHNPYNRSKIERLIPILEALCESANEDWKYVCYAERGYIYKDKNKPDWKTAHALLTRAIDLRANVSSPLSGRFELNRAMCAIMLGYSDEEIKRDLEAARRFEKDREIICELCEGTINGKLAQWLRRAGFCGTTDIKPEYIEEASLVPVRA
jgi:hypothetical protein